ncbi:carbohydrate ABC transporter permease [Meiothermus sp. QL-1]|uniref:carbohydrate ABC transporter permease n=1 Tax=Meiothermus sp. QL-1 TaxID=2058095 RepID=UPI000E09FCCD|nr:carbohydrate ABC transporter permease [Meiothermus sp. QL-1]RDI95216.1 carbohydrate ABC transporter permease [Meiothermus sp. QL-1]
MAGKLDERHLARQRWARVGWVYGIMLALAVFFVGPFYVAFLGSLKDNPLEWPFRYSFAQTQPKNWVAAWRLGQLGAGNPWTGGFAPGAEVPFWVTYFVPEGQTPEKPLVTVPVRRAGAGLGAIFEEVQAARYAQVSQVEELERRPFVLEGQPGQLVTYGFTIRYPRPEGAEGLPVVPRLPLDVEAPRGQQYHAAALDPNRLERRGRVASWDSVTPGLLGYVFRNYVRVFNEARDPNTGESFFLRWTLNTFFVCLAVVLTTLLFASLGGYALARMRLPGKQYLFAFIVFTMTVPSQATFISNYLVLRDLNLLGSLWGMVVWSAVGAGAVFIMKQFFESIPREIEEAALIDGASPATTFFRIILPLAAPALGALTILTFQGMWNEFFKAAVVLSGQQASYTLPLGLSFFRSAYGVAGDWGLMLASAFLSMIPIIVLFVVFQRYFVEGVSTAGIKG